MASQRFTQERKTKETDIKLSLCIDGSQDIAINTGIGFFDHMLEQLAYHARWDLRLECQGDTHIDDHHTIEDVAICLGSALQDAWRSRGDMRRYGQRYLPMDETLVLCAIDLCGRASAVIDLNFTREFTGHVSTEMWPHFFRTLAANALMSLHLREVHSLNNHHLIEASFKALAYSLDEALSLRSDQNNSSASTKGVL